MPRSALILVMFFAAIGCDRRPSGQAPVAQDSNAITVPAPAAATKDAVVLPDIGERHGWLAVSAGNVNAFDRSVPDTANIFALELFPADSAARAIAAGDTLRIVTPYQSIAAAVRQVGDRERGNRSSVVSVRVHAPGLAFGIDHPMAWVLPAGAPPVQGVRVSMHSPGDTARLWSADGHRLFILAHPQIAEVVAWPAGGPPTPILSVKADPAADRANGFERDSVLNYSGPDVRVPQVLEGYRFGQRGPWIFVVVVYGYECMNYRLVEIAGASARLLEDDLHYYSCVM
jgi:hypothetical protein